jgi:hypothetical protein
VCRLSFSFLESVIRVYPRSSAVPCRAAVLCDFAPLREAPLLPFVAVVVVPLPVIRVIRAIRGWSFVVVSVAVHATSAVRFP